MEKIKSKENKLVFSAEINESLANAIRRYVLQIPILAIDEVEISKNDSPLYDETVAHRIGLIPIKTEKKVSEKAEKKVKLSTNKEGYVFSGEIKGEVNVVYDKIPITLLDKGKELEFEGVARVGRGSEHSKFSPGFITYRHSCEIILDKKFADAIKKACPNCEVKEKGDKIIVIDNKEQEVCDLCEGFAQKEGREADTKVNDELIISVEGYGQISASDIFVKSIECLKKDLEEVGKGLK